MQEALRIGRWPFCMFVFVFMAYILINGGPIYTVKRLCERLCHRKAHEHVADTNIATEWLRGFAAFVPLVAAGHQLAQSGSHHLDPRGQDFA